ncbi:Putative transcriptional regulator, TetR-family [Corynebacterium glyciniphilum AJ 3170]|uniref:Putative transcriptional regulator, TetR-family n=1 Tax=Corynebacterium glyciniphilum AJ 3170 TaxID=1404245 RepID=X5EDK2_9CORY|nr:TetR/AcrR family transcriptional regulator [Corynebacterium glyciniphilum]AHW65475.1 Putative transcriptional regulator, TetR-family [Corynebacterium glyciniphilum AJ 3170]
MTSENRQRANRRASGNLRRQELLAAAAECFDDVGYAAVTIEMITRRAGTSRPTFYVYFKSKDEVFLALVEQVGTELIEAQFLDGLEEESAAAIIAATTRAYIDAIFANGGLVGMIELAAKVDPEVSAVWSRVPELTVRRYSRFLGSLSDDEADLAVPAGRLAHILRDGIHSGAMRLSGADDSTKEEFTHDQIATALRLTGLG